MILTQLTLANFGIYQGEHTFDLRPKRENGTHRPIILIGGKNGAGKTTLLQAIRLCLYGRLALGNRVRKSEYDSYIEQRFHRPMHADLSQRVDSARVGILFEHVHAGVKSTYDAVRSWQYKGSSIDENVSIYKNGQLMYDIAPEYWNDFLRDLIPPGVADLFFFDGEQIQALADERSESAALETAIGGLLNLDLVERLQTDLTVYLRQRSGRKHSKLQERFDAVVQQYDDKHEILGAFKQDRASLLAELGYMQKKVEDARQELLTQGAHFIEQHARDEARLAQVERELDQCRTKLRDLATGLLPFSFAPAWMERVRFRLEAEADLQKAKMRHAVEVEKAEEVRHLLAQETFRKSVAPELPEPQWEQLDDAIASVLAPKARSHESQPIIHQVSPQKRVQLLSQIERVNSVIPGQLFQLSNEMESLARERSDLQRRLRQVPDEVIAKPLIEEFQSRAAKVGELNERLTQKEEEISRTEYALAEIARTRSKLWHEIAKAGDLGERVDQVAKVQLVLERYLERITAIKLLELESLIAEFFNRLCRKELLVKEVKIDPERYSVTLYGENRCELPKSSLSAGEKQLYAMSLLWALRAVSGRQLPIIIDTPLGRLDRTHRERLMLHFFPHAAHQVILLSTDSEVDSNAVALLEPSLSHQYRLDFDASTGKTEIVSGYFEAQRLEMAA